jgi:hypothetical protein
MCVLVWVAFERVEMLAEIARFALTLQGVGISWFGQAAEQRDQTGRRSEFL